MMMGNRA
jgi:hypothetical protein